MAANKSKSNKQSNGREQRLRLNKFVLYLDENFCSCQQIIQLLDRTNVKYKRHEDKFRKGVADAEFLPSVGMNGWTLLTSDQRMGRRFLERDAIRQHRVRMFAFTSNNLGGFGMARALETALPKMRRFVQSNEPPFIASITSSGSLVMKVNSTELLRRSSRGQYAAS